MSKDKKYYENLAKETVFVNIIDFILYGVFRAKTDLRTKFMN